MYEEIEVEICRRCSCNWIMSCITEEHIAYWS